MFLFNRHNKAIVIMLSLLASSCTLTPNGESMRLSLLYGRAQVQDRQSGHSSEVVQNYLTQVKPILDKRCVVCHACYDAACQLKLSSAEGIDRGASKTRIYDIRLKAAETSRLFIDADTTQEWRHREFFPVLNERAQNAPANLESSVLYQMLALKQRNPLQVESNELLPSNEYQLGLDRNQQCATSGQFPHYARKYPQGGMPYALPKLGETEHAVLTEWLINGAPLANAPGIESHQEAISTWEAFLNGDSLKDQLIGRYIYEHLFLAHIHFDELGGDIYYQLVRSTTPPGEPISRVATRQPFQDPGVERVYYRLWQDPATIVAKNHLPYAFNAKRMAWLQELFYEQDFEVNKMPDFRRSVASNPFEAFDAIPVRSRYRFMLEEARFTIMGFMKGPVCRGQVALNVIQDHFWVLFVDPENQNTPEIDQFLMDQSRNLSLPAGKTSYASLVSIWTTYAQRNRKYLDAKMNSMDETRPNDSPLSLDYIWSGDGDNKNAALTVFRHFDSATVTHGLVGQAPKTAWLINYPLLERIHYLLVAEFDVYGNLAHQLSTRLYMDFLRQEGELGFLTLLPADQREELQRFWYRNADKAMAEHLDLSMGMFDSLTGIDLRTNTPQLELYGLLKGHLSQVLEDKYELDHEEVPPAHRAMLEKIHNFHGMQVSEFPEVALLSIDDSDGTQYLYSVLRNIAFSNITSLFASSKNRLPEEDYLTVVRGVVGDYPDAFWQVDSVDLEEFESAISNLQTADDYLLFMERFGVRRSHQNFWEHADQIHANYSRMEPIDGGLLDFNRLENR